MAICSYSIEGMDIEINIEKGDDRKDRMVSYVIRALRDNTGMTRAGFSAWLGIPLRTLQAWESGEREMPDYVLRLIAYKIRVEKEAGRIPNNDSMD